MISKFNLRKRSILPGSIDFSIINVIVVENYDGFGKARINNEKFIFSKT